MKIKFIIFSLALTFNANAQFLKKKQQKNSDPNLIHQQDVYPATSGFKENYDPNKDIRNNMKLKYLYQNLITATDTSKVASFMAQNQIGYNFISNDNDPIILHVVENGTFEMLKHFLERGSNPNLRTYFTSYGPVSMSTGDRESEIIYSRWALQIAFEKKDTAKMMLLKAYGALIEPLRIQLQSLVTDDVYGNFMMRLLGSNKVAPDALLNYIYFHNRDADIKQVEDLIARGSELNYIGNYNYTPLLKALENGLSNNIIELLVLKGANTNLGSISPLHFATCNNNLLLVKLLVEHGAEVNVKCAECKAGSGRSPINHALFFGSNDIVEYLFSKGAK